MTKITIEIDNQTYIADSSAGVGSCSTCDLRSIASSGKQCRWSQVCGFHLNGANFKRIKTTSPSSIADKYANGQYSGD